MVQQSHIELLRVLLWLDEVTQIESSNPFDTLPRYSGVPQRVVIEASVPVNLASPKSVTLMLPSLSSKMFSGCRDVSGEKNYSDG